MSLYYVDFNVTADCKSASLFSARCSLLEISFQVLLSPLLCVRVCELSEFLFAYPCSSTAFDSSI